MSGARPLSQMLSPEEVRRAMTDLGYVRDPATEVVAPATPYDPFTSQEPSPVPGEPSPTRPDTKQWYEVRGTIEIECWFRAEAYDGLTNEQREAKILHVINEREQHYWLPIITYNVREWWKVEDNAPAQAKDPAPSGYYAPEPQRQPVDWEAEARRLGEQLFRVEPPLPERDAPGHDGVARGDPDGGDQRPAGDAAGDVGRPDDGGSEDPATGAAEDARSVRSRLYALLGPDDARDLIRDLRAAVLGTEVGTAPGGGLPGVRSRDDQSDAVVDREGTAGHAGDAPADLRGESAVRGGRTERLQADAPDVRDGADGLRDDEPEQPAGAARSPGARQGAGRSKRKAAQA